MKTPAHTFAFRTLRRLARPLVRSLPIALAISFAALPQMSAQDGVQVGLDAAYEFGLDPAAARSPGFTEWCNCPSDGQILGHTAWIAATIFKSSFPWDGFGISSSVRFGSASTVFVGRNADSLEYQEDTRAGMLQFDLAGSLRLGDNFRLGAGPWVAIPISVDQSRMERLLSTTTRPNAGPDVQLPASSAAEDLGLSYGAILSGSVAVPLGPYSWLYPEVHARIDAGRLAAGEILGAFMIGGGTSFLFDPARFLLSAPPPLPPMAPLTPPPPIAPSTASITIYAVGRDGQKSDAAVIRARRERNLRQMPVVTTFRFVGGSEAFAEPYRLDHASRGEEIWIDSLAALGPDEVALQGINIIGSRLKAAPDARIKLVAVTVGSEKTALGVSRAARIRDYLHERWGIEEKRVMIRTIVSRNPLDSVPVVFVVCSNGTLAAPVEAEWISEGYDAPRIGLRSDIQAPAGVRSWRVEVFSGDSVVSSYSSDSNRGGTPAIQFDLSGLDPSRRISPLRARLVVEDSSGATITATDDLGVTLDEGHDSSTIGEQVRCILSSQSIAALPGRTATARNIARMVRAGARITLSAYGRSASDGGASRHEMEMFAERLRSAVGASDISITIDDRRLATTASHHGYDFEVAVSQLAPTDIEN